MKKYVKKFVQASASTVHGRSVMASTDLSVDEMWDYLLDIGISEETLQIVTDINGYSEQTMCDILYVVSEYRSFDQINDE